MAGRLAGWWTDPQAQGSYSIVAPGHAESRDRLREPVGGRVFFAGEALAGGGAMKQYAESVSDKNKATAYCFILRRRWEIICPKARNICRP